MPANTSAKSISIPCRNKLCKNHISVPISVIKNKQKVKIICPRCSIPNLFDGSKFEENVIRYIRLMLSK